MQIVLDQNEKLQVVYLCLTTQMPYFPDYGFSLDYSDSAYKQAKATLIANGTDAGEICLEDVQIEMIRQGFSLNFKDEEGEGDNDAALNLNQIEANWDKIPVQKVLDMALENGNWDVETADVVIQYILFGELVYG